MARLPRLIIPHQLHHIIQRGNDNRVIFADVEDYTTFLTWLGQASKQFQVAIHAYVLMPDHLHLMATPSDEGGLGRMMQWLGRHYVPYFNAKYQRVGTLWQGRYKATVIEAEKYYLPCSLYIESNPLRSGLVEEAAEYAWSSYQHHIGLKMDALITDHPLFWSMGNTPFQREAVYKERMAQLIPVTEIQAMTNATLKGWILGSDRFKAEMMKLTDRRVDPIRRGRPRKQIKGA